MKVFGGLRNKKYGQYSKLKCKFMSKARYENFVWK